MGRMFAFFKSLSPAIKNGNWYEGHQVKPSIARLTKL